MLHELGVTVSHSNESNDSVSLQYPIKAGGVVQTVIRTANWCYTSYLVSPQWISAVGQW